MDGRHVFLHVRLLKCKKSFIEKPERAARHVESFKHVQDEDDEESDEEIDAGQFIFEDIFFFCEYIINANPFLYHFKSHTPKNMP